MFKARNRQTVEAVARERGLRFIGFSVFGGDWYAARTEEELRRAGVADVICLNP